MGVASSSSWMMAAAPRQGVPVQPNPARPDGASSIASPALAVVTHSTDLLRDAALDASAVLARQCVVDSSDAASVAANSGRGAGVVSRMPPSRSRFFRPFA